MDDATPDLIEPPQAWAVVQGFLSKHGRAPDGSRLGEAIVQVMAVGAWVGARFAALDPSFGRSLAAEGNQRDGVVFRSLRRGFRDEFGEALERLVRDVFVQSGFDGDSGEDGKDGDAAADSLAEDDGRRAIDAAVAWLRGERNRDDASGEEES